jgi:hypothetical protein
VAATCGIAAPEIRAALSWRGPQAVARADGHRRSASTTASWLVDVLNVVTGNLDRPMARCSSTAAGRRTPLASPGAVAAPPGVGQLRGLGELFAMPQPPAWPGDRDAGEPGARC